MVSDDPSLTEDRDYVAEFKGRLLALEHENLVDLYVRLIFELAHPPEGWFPFGYHAGIPGSGPLEWWGKDDSGMPLWERPAS